MKCSILEFGISANALGSGLIEIYILSSKKRSSLAEPMAGLSNWSFWLGITSYGSIFLQYSVTLAEFPLKIARQIILSIPFTIARLFSFVIFHERFYWTTGTSIIHVTAGVALVKIWGV